jgi:hypothetical protein
MTWGWRLYFPSEKGVLRIFITLKSIAPGRVEPANLGSNGKHAKHYITEGDHKAGKYRTHIELRNESPV